MPMPTICEWSSQEISEKRKQRALKFSQAEQAAKENEGEKTEEKVDIVLELEKPEKHTEDAAPSTSQEMEIGMGLIFSE